MLAFCPGLIELVEGTGITVNEGLAQCCAQLADSPSQAAVPLLKRLRAVLPLLVLSW